VAEPIRFGKYLLTRALAQGGMATVHLAILPGVEGFQKELVVKQILPELAKDERFVEMFVSEAKNAVALQHGNIVPVYELGIVDGVYFIAMERVHGRTLADVLDAGVAIPPEASVHVAIEVLRALVHAHGRTPPLVHRDLSGRNVMITWEGEVKVLDFGISGRAGASGRDAPMGSVGYLAPEQIRGEPADPRTDLFAVGILLHEMLTGEPLFWRKDTAEARKEVIEGTSRAPSSVRAESPPELDRAVLRALERDPAKRPQTAEEMIGELRRWLAARGGFDPAALGKLVAATGPGETEETEETEETLGRTIPLADPAAAARQVTIATSVVLADAQAGSYPKPPAATVTSSPPSPTPRSGAVAIGAAAGLAVLLAAWVLGSGGPPAPPKTARPATSEPDTTAPEPETAAPATAAPATAAADAGTRPVLALKGRLFVLVLPSGEVTVGERTYSRFPADGIELPAARTQIAVRGPGGEIKRESVRIYAGRSTQCTFDFTDEVVQGAQCRYE